MSLVERPPEFRRTLLFNAQDWRAIVVENIHEILWIRRWSKGALMVEKGEHILYVQHFSG